MQGFWPWRCHAGWRGSGSWLAWAGSAARRRCTARWLLASWCRRLASPPLRSPEASDWSCCQRFAWSGTPASGKHRGLEAENELPVTVCMHACVCVFVSYFYDLCLLVQGLMFVCRECCSRTVCKWKIITFVWCFSLKAFQVPVL